MDVWKKNMICAGALVGSSVTNRWVSEDTPRLKIILSS